MQRGKSLAILVGCLRLTEDAGGPRPGEVYCVFLRARTAKQERLRSARVQRL